VKPATPADVARLLGDVLFLSPACADPAGAARWEDCAAEAMDRALRGDMAGALARVVSTLPGMVLPPARPTTELLPRVSTGFGPAGIPIVALPDPAAWGTPEGAARVADAVAEALGSGPAVVDLRRAPGAARGFAGQWPGVLGAARPAERFRVHTGWKSEGRPDTGAFGSAWLVRDPVGGLPAARVAFLVDPGDALPPAALAWRAAGRATWVVSGGGDPVAPTGSTLGHGAFRVVAGEFAPPGPGLRCGAGEDPVAVAARWVRGDAPPPPPLAFPEVPAGVPRPTHRDPRVSALRALLMVARFHPYRADALDAFLETSVPRIWNPSDRVRIAALRAVLARTGDGHARVRVPDPSDPLAGVPPAVRLRMVAGAPTIARLLHPSVRAYGAQVGDRVERIDEVPVAVRVAALRPLLPAGTPGAADLYAANRLLVGSPGRDARVVLRTPGEAPRMVLLPRDPAVFAAGDPAERDGPAAGWLRPGIGYIDLDRIGPGDLPAVLSALRGAKEWVVDLRGRAREAGWLLAAHLAPPGGVDAARFVRTVVGATAALDGGGAMRIVPARVEPAAWRFGGKTTVWVDERTQSQSELAALLLRACGARLAGSRTAGALGDVTEVEVAPGVVAAFSGQRIEGAQGETVHGVGLVPSGSAPRFGSVRPLR